MADRRIFHAMNPMDNTTQHYAAPWGRNLVITSLFVIAVCGVGFLLPWFAGTKLAAWKSVLLASLLVLPVLFIIRGYEIGQGDLFIKRLFWRTRIPLSDLENAEVMPDVMKGSLRLFGNGGAYVISGWFRNRTLGGYRAFVNNDANSVVLKFRSRTIVVSPGSPDDFVSNLRTRIKDA